MKNSGCLCTVPLFAPLSLDEKNEIKCLLHHQTFKKGEIIFSPSSEEQLLIISLGAMKIYRISRTGKEQLIRIVKEGDYDGENYLFGLPNDCLYGEAVEETKTCTLYKSDFNKVMARYPQLSYRLLQLNACKTVAVEKQLQLLAFDRIEDRLALYLNQLSIAAKMGEPITLPISIRELANYLATSPETISRKLRDFQERQLITRKGKQITLLEEFWLIFNYI